MDLFERGGLLLTDTSLLVIDEADRMLDMGFIPDVEKIVGMLPETPADPVLQRHHGARDPPPGRRVPARAEGDRGQPPGERRDHDRRRASPWWTTSTSARRCAG